MSQIQITYFQCIFIEGYAKKSRQMFFYIVFFNTDDYVGIPHSFAHLQISALLERILKN